MNTSDDKRNPLTAYILDNGDPTFLFNISNLHIITFTKNLISEIS